VAFVPEEDIKKKGMQPGCCGSLLAFWNGIRSFSAQLDRYNLVQVSFRCKSQQLCSPSIHSEWCSCSRMIISKVAIKQGNSLRPPPSCITSESQQLYHIGITRKGAHQNSSPSDLRHPSSSYETRQAAFPGRSK
jgi:hypothetical protein